MKVLIDLSLDNLEVFNKAIALLYRTNERLPKDERFFLEAGTIYKYSEKEEDLKTNTYSDTKSVFIFDTKKDFIASLNDGDAFQFFFNHKPEKINGFTADYVSYW